MPDAPYKMPDLKKATFDERKAESLRLLSEYPDRVPIICEKAGRSDIATMKKREFAAECTMTVGELLYLIRKWCDISQAEALFIFVNDILAPTSAEMGVLYEWHKSEDGWLYVSYAIENTFGTQAKD